MFTGCGTALVTPFKPDLSLDVAATRRLIERQIREGIDFLVPCGTTGESPTLTREEHLRVVREAARLLADEKEYGAWAWEIHHDTKKDAPSGTMIKLVDEMTAAGYRRNIDVSSNRAGRHPGTHEIGFDSGADTITLRHTARSREGFARGALKAAQWIVGKQGVFEFSDVLFSGR